jgi:putative ABC transport system permease protein
VGLAIVLVLVSALLVRAIAEFDRLSRPAIDVKVYVARLVTPGDMNRAARATVYARVLEQAATAEGVQHVALTSELPPPGPSTPITASSSSGSSECRMSLAFVSPQYFDTLGLRIERGLIPDTTSGGGVVVSASAARACWSGASTQEWRIRIPSESISDWMPVMGVTSDLVVPAPAGHPELRIGEPSNAWVVGSRDWPQTMHLLVRPQPGTAVSTTSLVNAVSRATSSVAMEPLAPLEEKIAERRSTLVVWILGSVALVALILATTGVYAALSQSCSLRIVDLGIRLALGADPRRLVIAAVARDAPLVAIGVVVGLTGTLWVTRIVWRNLLVISAMDPRMWMAVCGILAAAGLLAAVGPALRAIRVDPITVLRSE